MTVKSEVGEWDAKNGTLGMKLAHTISFIIKRYFEWMWWMRIAFRSARGEEDV